MCARPATATIAVMLRHLPLVAFHVTVVTAPAAIAIIRHL
jgi:hypothetical protein